MAKRTSRARPRCKSTDPIIEARAEKTSLNIREHWERGQKARDERATPGGRSLRQLALEYRINANTLRKERLFAELYRNETQLDELLCLRRPNGMPLHWGHVVYLITVADAKARRTFQNAAAKEGWSAPELREAIKQARGTDPAPGGRPQKIPASAERRLRLMIAETDRWLGRYRAVVHGEGGLFEQVENGEAGGAARQARELSGKLKEVSIAAGKAAKKLETAG